MPERIAKTQYTYRLHPEVHRIIRDFAARNDRSINYSAEVLVRAGFETLSTAKQRDGKAVSEAAS